MNVFGDRRGVAVRHAVLAQISRTESRGYDLQCAALRQRARRRRPAALASATAAGRDRPGAVADLSAHGVLVAAGRALPLGARQTLPRRLAGGRPRRAE